MNKKLYEQPRLDILLAQRTDIIMTSGENPGGDVQSLGSQEWNSDWFADEY